jgi:sugar O-acyltransferase (sialic acid O-acetyltransferase NeuD family)
MLIVGAKGFAKEVLEILHQNGEVDNLCFYDDINLDDVDILYNVFPVIRRLADAEQYFKEIDSYFTLGIGNPKLRFKLFQKFTDIGGRLASTISKNAEIGHYGIRIDEGCNILAGVKISNDVMIGEGTIIYYNSIITHDVVIGKFCEISPDVKLLGGSEIGDFVQIGAGVIIFPDVTVGSHSIIAAGSVVRNNVPENVMVAGVPAVQKKYLL